MADTTYLKEKELYADSIEFSYRASHQLLTGVYISCKVGEVVALLGRNGCGKSTLMKILFGVLSPKHAYITLHGRRIIKPFVSQEVCYLPQQRFLPTHKTVQQMITFMLRSPEQRAAVAKDEVIANVLTQKIADLSVGEVRYLELSLLLHQQATFYLLDEPFSGVSPYLKEQIQQLIDRYRGTKGFIISDHHYRSVLDICSKIILLQNGGCRLITDKKELEYFYVPEGTFDAGE
ncbi:MAG TPA: ATP-binding cassette domain-containing protein [Sphingobacterium sp.]|nr:ATP-binding cassette domain-containing protein [Sphingobacterium sp.]